MSRVFKLDYIPDSQRGRPLWDAKIYIGVPNQDPTIPSNQLTLTGDIGFPLGGVITVPQPVRTNKGGVTVYNSSPLDLNTPGQAYAIAIYDRNDNLVYNFPNVDGTIALNTTAQEEITGLNIWPETGNAEVGQTIPAGTDAIRFAFEGRNTLFTIKPPVAVTGLITDITINTSGIGTLTVDGSDVYDLQEFNTFIAANDGDSQLVGGAIWPLSSQDSAQNGDSLPLGTSVLTISDDRYYIIGYLDGVSSGQTLDNIDLTPPYSCTIDGNQAYLGKLPYYQPGRSANDIRALGAVGDFDDNTKLGTDNSEVFRAISRDLGGEWTGIGKFYTSTTTNYKKRTAWSAPDAMGAGVIFDFSIVTADGIPGHFYHYIDTDADDSGVPFVTSATTGADGSVIGDGVTIRNVTNTNKPTLVANAYGVWAKVRIKIGKSNISNWQSNNVNIVATEISNDPLIRGNANSFQLDNPILWGSGQHGFFCSGADVNAGIGSNISAYRNVGYGIYDSSFLGNFWPAPNIGLNDTGGFIFDNLNNRSIVINPYFELGSAGFEVTSSGRQGVIGGNVDDTSLSDAAFLYVDQSEWRANTSFASYQVADSSNFRSRIGGATSASTLGIQAWESESIDSNTWRLQWEPLNKSDFHLRYANLVGSTAYTVTGENTTSQFARSAIQQYKFWVPNEMMIGSTARGAAVKKSSGTPPATGLAGRGDTVFNNNPTATGQPSGWNCITSGTNGVDAVYGVTSTIS